MTVIDGRTNTIVANPTLGSFPWGVAVDPASNSVFVTIGNQSGTSPVNLVREFSGVTNKEVDRTSLPDSPGGIAVNPATDTLYVGDFFAPKVAVVSG